MICGSGFRCHLFDSWLPIHLLNWINVIIVVLWICGDLKQFIPLVFRCDAVVICSIIRKGDFSFEVCDWVKQDTPLNGDSSNHFKFWNFSKLIQVPLKIVQITWTLSNVSSNVGFILPTDCVDVWYYIILCVTVIFCVYATQ